MNALAGSCAQAGIALVQKADHVDAVPYFWAVRRFAPSDDPHDPVAIFQSLIHQQILDKLAISDSEAALRFDAIGGVFDPEARSRLSPDQAVLRSVARANDADRALLEGRLERAAAFALASLSLDPGNQLAARCRDDVVTGLLKRAEAPPETVANLASILAVALAVALGASDQRLRLMAMLEEVGDFPSVILICEEIEREGSTSVELLTDCMQRRFCARHRLAGLEREAAAAAAGEDLRQWLLSLGASEMLDTPMLRHRVMLCFSYQGYRQTLDDLRELKRRQPDDPWIAYNLCVILRHAQHPDLVGSLDLIASEAADSLVTLRARFDLMRSMGAMPQLMAISARLAQANPALGTVPDLYAMALDVEAEPALRIARPRSNRHLLYATLVCWGEAYIDLMEQTCLASLLAPGNFPALARKTDIVLELYTGLDDLPRLQGSALLRRLADHCEIRIHCFPTSINGRAKTLSYLMLGFATHATALRAAEKGADLLFLYADVAYAKDNFSAVAKRLSEGRVALFSDALNLYATPMLKRLASYRDGAALILSSEQLISAASHCLAKRTLDSFYRADNPTTPNEVCRMMFPTKRGLRTHGLVIAPLYVSHAAFAPVVHTDFATQDGRFVEHVLNQVEEAEMEVLSGEEFCVAELCDGDGMAFPLIESGWERAIEAYFLGHGLNQRRLWLFRQPILYPGLTPPGEAVLSDDTVDAQVESVLALFKSSPHLIDLATEQALVRANLYPR